MSKVHYFQRYSQKENVITNNTLLLLSRLYSSNVRYLETVLTEIPDCEDVIIPVGVKMQQQSGTSQSIPDGEIKQESFRVLIETKKNALDLGIGQLQDHLANFGDEETKILLVLTADNIQESRRNEIEKKIHREGVLLFTATFQDIVNVANTIAEENQYDFALKEVVEDFEDYCYETGLLPRDRFRMRAVSCGSTLDENMEYDLYYDEVGSYRSHSYVGVYKNKVIRAIGKITKIIWANVNLKDEKVDAIKGEYLDREKLTSDEEKRILEAVRVAHEKRGWEIFSHRFYLVDEFYKTDYKKISAYGLRSTKYFDLGSILELGDDEELPSTQDIADALKGATWQ